MNQVETYSAPEKKVFLIGDSIRQSYCEVVKECLRDIGDVIYPSDNCRFTQYVITNIHNWAALCDPAKVAVVHFNCGHWDIGHWYEDPGNLNSVEVYSNNIARIIFMLKNVFPNAKIIFATTTAMNPNGSQSPATRTNEEIEIYNRAAVAACGSDVMIDDLYAVSQKFGTELFADYCHPSKEGARILGETVAEYIRKLLLS